MRGQSEDWNSLPKNEARSGLEAIASAESGISIIPTVIEVMAFAFFMRCVTMMTHVTTMKGFTFAIHSGDAWLPTVRSTYFGMVAYI